MKFSAESVMRFPQSYRSCLNNSFFNAFEFWKWIGHALIESLLLVTPPMYVFCSIALPFFLVCDGLLASLIHLWLPASIL
jgi:hypothetical protein